ncbi:MAG: hypothetical protein Q8922_03015 [Bacteroidota bacterium]|nr:hypothetical protein [Bacteroidota bacterium]MDP4232936.1 hypothetical protein [Bacteroidota bacterium]MDP4286883.1 hypothetical protein [Bacteroidota bacterium]
MGNKQRNLRILTALLVLIVCSCRTVSPVREIRTAWEPDISRITLKNGTIIEFDENFGWYDKQGGIVEGMTRNHEHIQYHLIEIAKVETVRSYSIFFAIASAAAVFALGIYLVYKLLTLV